MLDLFGQAGRFFDRRSIVSAFAPSVVLWTSLCVVPFVASRGWSGTLHAWDGVSGTAKTALALVFLAWLVFWTFLTLSFRTSFVRLFEGYWPQWRVLRPLHAARKRRWERHWDVLDARDQALEREQVEAARAAAANEAANDWKEAGSARKRVAAAAEGRRALERELLVLLPSRDAIMATRLGNVLRAAEEAPRKRYMLDPIVIWPRLDPLLPADAREAFYERRTPLDLMITLSLFALLAGAPLATILAVTPASTPPWWLGLAVAGGAALVGARSAAAFALLAPALGGAAAAIGGGADDPLRRAAVAVAVVATALALASVAYRTAVEAAAAFGESIKAMIDLYRWNVLTSLRLRLPSSLAEERLLWDQLVKMLYRGYEPGSAVQYEVAKGPEVETAASLERKPEARE